MLVSDTHSLHHYKCPVIQTVKPKIMAHYVPNRVFLVFRPSEYGKDLEEVIKDETSGDFTTALLAMLKTNKSVNMKVDMDQAKKDAEVISRKFTFER